MLLIHLTCTMPSLLSWKEALHPRMGSLEYLTETVVWPVFFALVLLVHVHDRPIRLFGAITVYIVSLIGAAGDQRHRPWACCDVFDLVGTCSAPIGSVVGLSLFSTQSSRILNSPTGTSPWRIRYWATGKASSAHTQSFHSSTNWRARLGSRLSNCDDQLDNQVVLSS